LPAGAFLVSAARKGFVGIQYGQKQWKSAGLPVILEENQSIEIEIRLPRLGAIAGRVVDENDVGMPDHDVVVYRVAKPALLVGRPLRTTVASIASEASSWAFLVRTAAKMFKEGGYLPTFYHDVGPMDQARTLEVTLDQQVDDVAIRPIPAICFNFPGRSTPAVFHVDPGVIHRSVESPSMLRPLRYKTDIPFWRVQHSDLRPGKGSAETSFATVERLG
jgi:hypothetical protein